MRNPIDIDRAHSRAIWQEIGERLQPYLRVERELRRASEGKSTRSVRVGGPAALNRSRRGTTVLGDVPNEDVSRDVE